MSETSEPERLLNTAKQRFDRALAALTSDHRSGGWEEYHEASGDVLRLERLLAASKGEEYAEDCGFPLTWDGGAPMPHVVQSEQRTLLTFLLREPAPEWDGSSVTIKSPSDGQPEPLGLVEFDRCICTKLGAPNDEVLEGHPLHGRGLEWYGAQRVVNSRWLTEIEAINSVHSCYRPEPWRELTHFVFWFHDSTFECIARSFKVETHRLSMKEMLVLMVDRLTSRH